MSAEGQLGIYWGSNSFSIVENISGRFSNVFLVPFDTEITEGEGSIPDELRFPTILKKTFEFRSVKSRNTSLSLPTNDLIFRSFEIPFMNKSEIASVVEFEITKYIPLKLEDLIFTYHTIPSANSKQKNLTVLFIAIRRSRLDSMVAAIQQSELQLRYIEPAPVSLIHLLKHHRIIGKKEAVAIIEIGSDNSEIIILDDETINFMRQLNVTLGQADLSTLQGTLQNEIRVSFNFYSRQRSSSQISKIIIISEQNIPNVDNLLSKDLNIPVSFLPIDRFIQQEEYRTIPHLTALGSTLRKEKFSPKYFDLSSEAIELMRSGKDPFESTKRYFSVAGIFLTSAIVLFLTILISNNMLSSYTTKANDLKSRLGSFVALTEQDLISKKDSIAKEITTFTSVRFESDVALIMSEVSKALPEGTWLTGIQVSYSDKKNDAGQSKITLSLNGKIYSPDANEQFRILNTFIENLKTNPFLSVLYDSVNRDSASRSSEGENHLTTFQITCK
ncbi:MAG: pilus assembly protein PilM [Candidatus Omnitrophota bacterium]